MTKKSKRVERTWNFKIFKHKTITKEIYEEEKDDVETMINNLLTIVKNPDLFNHKIHCKMYNEFIELSTKILSFLDDVNLGKLKKISNFFREKCKSAWFAKPKVYVDKDFL